MRTIGNKIKNLRLQKGLTQEELGERTDLSKGYISQIEREISSPSIETLFSLLEVLGISAKDFFDEDTLNQKVVYTQNDVTSYADSEQGYHVTWLIPESNEKEMEPVLLHLAPGGTFKAYEPSGSETFVFVLEGRVTLRLGHESFVATQGETFYYKASEIHQLRNESETDTKVLVTATDSYL
ncbi:MULTISPECIES: helix-turn-helix domain-containing protein [Exiguobacterium]|uniref:helix-turn-helix domain-containing protein n=1 Tax=Exiguobacterium TaxID=33986 RepID=UPI001AE49ABB|nr:MULTISPECIES: XRE family transcriptional regulator [Exiguobacterium]MCT4781209.1 XRE family transcriptional regulator [Exiguobacterium soli]